MKLSKLILLLVSIFMIGISLTAIFYFTFMIDNVITVPYYFNVENKTAGFDAGTDQLGFGTIPIGGLGKRSIILNSKNDVNVNIFFSGNGTEYIHTNSSFFLPKNTNKSISVKITIPKNVTKKHYEGKLIAVFFHKW